MLEVNLTLTEIIEMAVVKTHGKGQIIMPKDIRDKLGIKPGTALSVDLVDDHVEIRPLPDDPIEFLTGFFKDHPESLAQELLEERKMDDRTDETDSL
jgi:AbrB family looped-hinge helix DNA binding protein